MRRSLSVVRCVSRLCASGIAVTVLAAAAVTATPAPGHATASPRARATATRQCSSAATRVWFGLGLGAHHGSTYFYPLEFSNIGRHTCTLYGYPGVSAYRGALHQLGPAASRIRRTHGIVTLAPGATAHALLAIVDWGARCTRAAVTDGLKVYAPGERGAQEVGFSFRTCRNRETLSVGPVRAGTGVPGHTSA